MSNAPKSSGIGRFILEVELLERHAEIERLGVALDAAVLGSGRVVLIRGEPGIGKTALVRAFLQAQTGAAEILVGACDDLFTPRPLSPLWDMSRDEPAIAEGLEAGDRHVVYEVVLDLTKRSLRPTILVIEDAHWADEATLDLIRHVGRRIYGTHGVLMITYRPGELAIDHSLRSVIGDLPPQSVDRIVLSPLSRAAVEILAGDPAISERIHILTGGNPFLVTEMLAAGGQEIPPSVIDSVVARVAELSPMALDLVEVVSLVPGRAEMSLVEDLVDGWVSAVDEVERHGILELRDSHVMFRHELARRAVEQSLPAGRRTELSRQIVAYLIARGADSSLIVHHAVAAGDAAALLAHAPAAAKTATAVASHREAYGYYETLRPFYGRLPPEERAELLQVWSVSASVVNDLARAAQLIDEAIDIRRDADDRGGLGSAVRWRSRIAWLQGERTSAENYADEAVDILEPLGPSAELAYAYSAQSQIAMLANQVDRAVERARQAIDTARPLGEDRIVAHAMVNLGSSWTVGTYPENAEPIREAIVFARQKGLREEVVRGTVNYAWGALLARDLETAERRAVEAAKLAAEAELEAYDQYARATLALVKMMQGEWFVAEDILRPILAQLEVGPTTAILARTVLGRLLARRGETDAGAVLEDAWEKALPTGELQRTGLASAARAECAWITGDLVSIPDLIGPDLARANEVGAHWIAADLVMWGWLGGHESERPHQLPAPYSLLFEGEWGSAAEEWKSLGMPYERALALGQGDEEALLEAVSILDDLGAEPVAARFRAKLRKMGVQSIPRGPTQATQSHPVGLTPRQAEVIELLAEGLSNPEIGDRLFISPRTVEHHVSAILTKLGVSSRAEAVESVRRLGVSDQI